MNAHKQTAIHVWAFFIQDVELRIAIRSSVANE